MGYQILKNVYFQLLAKNYSKVYTITESYRLRHANCLRISLNDAGPSERYDPYFRYLFINKKLVFGKYFYESFWVYFTDRLIGVHCTHGLNRTGLMICAYMIQYCNIQPSDAMFSEYNKSTNRIIN